MGRTLVRSSIWATHSGFRFFLLESRTRVIPADTGLRQGSRVVRSDQLLRHLRFLRRDSLQWEAPMSVQRTSATRHAEWRSRRARWPVPVADLFGRPRIIILPQCPFDSSMLTWRSSLPSTSNPSEMPSRSTVTDSLSCIAERSHPGSSWPHLRYTLMTSFRMRRTGADHQARKGGFSPSAIPSQR
jgi:hypothetical protein